MFNGIKEITMNTIEIAAMTGKRHDHVLRDVDRVIAQVGAPQIWGHRIELYHCPR